MLVNFGISPVNLEITSGLLILMHAVITLPNAISKKELRIGY